jgi:hypothetical protein
MKNLILAIAFCFSSAFIYAQECFEGSWVTPTSEYVTIIYEGEYGVRRVVNKNVYDGYLIEEVIVKKNKKTFTTKIQNYSNGYFVTIKYKIKDKNTLICRFKGDFNKTLEYKRLIINK